jgi:hypothetical protein
MDTDAANRRTPQGTCAGNGEGFVFDYPKGVAGARKLNFEGMHRVQLMHAKIANLCKLRATDDRNLSKPESRR